MLSEAEKKRLEGGPTRVRVPTGATSATGRVGAPKRHDQRADVVDADWSADYQADEAFRQVWQAVSQPKGAWPEGYKVLRGKLYHEERLCVPADRLWRLCREYHECQAHVTAERLLPGMVLRFEAAPGTDLKGQLEKESATAWYVRHARHPTGP